MPIFSLKWTENDPSNSIILCFDRKWLKPIEQATFNVVYRKAWPKRRNPKSIFAYVGTPVSAIVAKLSILQWSLESLDVASRMVTDAELTEQELADYVGAKGQVYVVKIGKILAARKHIPLSVLSGEYGYSPSPAAASLSGEGERILTALGEFSV